VGIDGLRRDVREAYRVVTGQDPIAHHDLVGNRQLERATPPLA
jgi:hypothetical protein